MNQRGLTMIETLVAISILLIAILAIIRIFPTGLQATKTAEMKTVAAFLAQEMIEEVASYSYADIPVNTNEEYWYEPTHKVSDDPDSPFYFYTRETEIIYVNPNNNPLTESVTDLGAKQIRTTVYWNVPPGNSAKSLDIYTLRSQR